MSDMVIPTIPWNPIILPMTGFSARIDTKKRNPVDPRKRYVRKLLNTRANMPVVFFKNAQPPQIVGSPPKLTTRNGTPIRHYVAYKLKGRRNIVYQKSTMQIEVGEEWEGFNTIPK